MIFFGKEFSDLESVVLKAVENSLDDQAQAIFVKQISAVNDVRRRSNGQEVLLYRKKWGKVVLDQSVVFPYLVEEAKLATVTFSVVGEGRARKAVVWIVTGHVFTINFNKSPKDIGRNSKIAVTRVTLHIDPMETKAPYPEPIAEPVQLSGWLFEWGKKQKIAKSARPVGEQRIAEVTARLPTTLPADYLELVRQSEGLLYGDCAIMGITEIYEINIESKKYIMIASIGADGAIAVSVDEPIGDIFLLSYEEMPSRNLGKSFRGAVEKASGSR